MERFDVAIVGAGLAGLQCARLLAERGMSVLLADARRSLDRSIHTTGILVRKTLEDFDLPEDCLGPCIRDVELYSPAGRCLALSSRRDEFRIARMGPLYLRFLDQAVRGGVSWRPATRYLGCEPSETGSLLRFERGGAHAWIQARFVVGADGARSLVGQDLGLDVNREWIVGVEEVLRAGPDERAAPRLRCFLDPEIAPGYLGWIAEDGEEIHVGVGGYTNRFDALDALRRFRERLVEAGELGEATFIERRGGRIPVGGILRRIACDRGLLVGDAAGAPSPLTAGGLDPCFRLSRLAAEVIETYLSTGDRSVLACYSGRRFRSRFMARRWMRTFFTAMRSRLALEASFAFASSAPFRPLVRHIFFGRNSFPDLAPLGAGVPRLSHR
jgi:flavin-dependent dehydrogenase